MNVSQNVVLKHLFCQNNQLSVIDVSANLNLETLNCFLNNLTTLDVSVNTALNNLHTTNNQLTSLNVANGNNINFTVFNATNNPNLTCIQVDDVTYSTTNWTDIDSWANFSTNCATFGLTYVPDNNFEAYLEANGMGNGIANDYYVTTANINTVTNLDVSYQNIADLTGIEDFVALEVLNCFGNQLTNLAISNNTALTTLWCASNQLTSLDVTTNPALIDLSCYLNQLTSLDVSANTALIMLDCRFSPLTSLNVANGNNINVTYFTALGNPDLTCIQVDDATYSTTYWTNIDSGASFSTNCAVSTTDYEFENNFSIYPNPVKNRLTIESERNSNYTIYSITGKKIRNGKIIIGSNTVSLDKVSTGVYFIKIDSKNKSFTKKIIKL